MIGPSEKSARILAELQAFMAEHIYPNEVAHQEALAGADNRFASMPLVEFLKDRTRPAARGSGISLYQLNMPSTAIMAA